MLRKTFALASLAMIGYSSKLQANMHYDECVVTDKLVSDFDRSLVEWSNEVDNNMEIITNRDSYGADLDSIDVCFTITYTTTITGRKIAKKRIKGFATYVTFDDGDLRQTVKEAVGITDGVLSDCVNIKIEDDERISMISNNTNWEAFGVTVAKKNSYGAWKNDTVKIVFDKNLYEMPYSNMMGTNLDVDKKIKPIDQYKVIGVQGVFDQDGEPTGLDWILLDTDCTED